MNLCLAESYVPGRCNIGVRGRAMRVSTGIVVVGVFFVLGLTVFPSGVLGLARLALFLPFYAGFLAVLEGGMSFCVLHAGRGTYDFHEKLGPLGRSETRGKVVSEGWKRLDQRKAQVMHLEALAGGVVLALVLFLV